jgi:dipeptidyl aminopeptidase/acylaminoacyl peptidase
VELAALTSTPASEVNAVVAFYAPSDLIELAKTSPLVPDNLRRAINSSFSAFFQVALKQLSPIEHVSGKMPAFLLIHGTSDGVVPISQSVRFRDAVRAAGGQCELYEVPGAGHGLRWWDSRDSGAYQRALFRWLGERNLGQSQS